MRKTTLTALLIGLLAAGSASATPFSISMVADNDFAIFSGTSTSVNNVLYQNNVIWNDQISALSTLTFNLAAGDNTFYVLAMGGGGPEDISGTVNGVNMTDSSVTVSMSSDLSSYLTNYHTSYASIENGSYTPTLAEVQTALPNLTWGAPTLDSSQTVITAAGFGSGFRFDTTTAHLFSFQAEDVNVPEPSVLFLMTFGLAGLAFASRRKRLPA